MGIEAAGGTGVRVCYLGLVRRAAGTSEERVRLDESATLGTLLYRLAERHGRAFRDHVFEGGELSRGSSILIDGHNCRSLGGLDARLDGRSEVEVIVFGPPANGG
ncbi:MAG TPA: MoaD/ThiS family protein [Candidatus Limnocylindria bacterium]|nr:MoaD/ThiS family protein [Candidatus Limnocylindria bacterium]